MRPPTPRSPQVDGIRRQQADERLERDILVVRQGAEHKKSGPRLPSTIAVLCWEPSRQTMTASLIWVRPARSARRVREAQSRLPTASSPHVRCADRLVSGGEGSTAVASAAFRGRPFLPGARRPRSYVGAEGGSERPAGAAAGSIPGRPRRSLARRARRLEPAGERQHGESCPHGTRGGPAQPNTLGEGFR
jgi:hypothetical protein